MNGRLRQSMVFLVSVPLVVKPWLPRTKTVTKTEHDYPVKFNSFSWELAAFETFHFSYSRHMWRTIFYTWNLNAHWKCPFKRHSIKTEFLLTCVFQLMNYQQRSRRVLTHLLISGWPHFLPWKLHFTCLHLLPIAPLYSWFKFGIF